MQLGCMAPCAGSGRWVQLGCMTPCAGSGRWVQLGYMTTCAGSGRWVQLHSPVKARGRLMPCSAIQSISAFQRSQSQNVME